MAKKTTDNTTNKIRIRLKAYDHKVADMSAKQIVEIAARTGAKVNGPIPLPTKRTLYTVSGSPAQMKDNSQESFETRVHKRIIDVLEPSPQTIDKLMSLNLPAGCDVEIKM